MFIKNTSLIFKIIATIVIVSVTNIVNAEDIKIYENDHKNQIVIQYDSNSTFSPNNNNLFFGENLSHALSFNQNSNIFVFTDDVDFTNNEIKNVRLENNILANKTCNSSHSGEIYYNSADNISYICSGSIWRSLENQELHSEIGLKPYLESLNKVNISQNETTDIIVTGGNFTPHSVFELTSGAILNSTVINSNNSVTINITAGSSNASVFVTSPSFFGNNLLFTVQ